MRRTLLPSILLLLGVAFLVRSRFADSNDRSRPLNAPAIELAPLCPWREPQRDLAALFPEATGYTKETRILSGVRPQLQKQLGRVPSADENALHIYRVKSPTGCLGSVLVRRVKGEHGGIEIVTAVDPAGTVTGVRVQSQREPEATAAAITSQQWLGAFAGKAANSPLTIGHDLPEVGPEPRASAQAIADGVRSQLVLLSLAEQTGDVRYPAVRSAVKH